MERAPLFAEVAEGPGGGEAFWLRCDDGVRIRIGVWPRTGARGTVLLFCGRTEYAEKYGRTAADLARRGYATLAVDWRGQGLADRLLPQRATGHVRRYVDYQSDVRAVMAAAAELELPRPFHLLAHSMGGSIGLRALIEGLDVAAAAFSAPMWGILIAPLMRPFAGVVARAAGPAGFGHRFAPGTGEATYVLEAPFEDNRLTRDREMYDYMRRQALAHPELTLGGPSLSWVHEALSELRALAAARLPALPVYCAVGGNERIVDIAAIHATMARWPSGRLRVFERAEHELLMEVPEVRDAFLDAAVETFESGQGAPGFGTGGGRTASVAAR